MCNNRLVEIRSWVQYRDTGEGRCGNDPKIKG